MQLNRARGDTRPDTFTVTLGKSRDGVDISGWSFKMTLNAEEFPVDEVKQLYQMTGVVVNPAEGVVSFSPTEAQADRTGYFYYDVQAVDGNGSIYTLVKDSYIFTQDITK